METIRGKRILFLSWKDIHNPSSGGAEIVTDALAEHLAQHNDVIYITSLFPGALQEATVHGYHVIRKGNPISSIIYAFFLFKTLHREKQFDLIIDQVHGVPFFSIFYPNHPPIATIAYEIAGDLWSAILPRSIGKYIDACWLFLYRHLPFITISKSTSEELVAHRVRPNLISIIPLFTNIALPTMPTKTDKPTLIVLGRIAPGKRIEHALEAFFILKKTIPLLRLIIIGKKEGKYTQYFQEIQKRSSDSSDIILMQNVDEQTKLSWLAQSHIHIMPSKKEGYGISILEAAACGTPSVGYMVPGIRDAIIAEETGILVPQQIPSSLAASIANLLSDIEKFHYLQKNSFAHAQLYTKQHTLQTFDTIIEQII